MTGVQTCALPIYEVIDRLAKKYLDVDTYPFRREGEIRVTVRIRPDRIAQQPV